MNVSHALKIIHCKLELKIIYTTNGSIKKGPTICQNLNFYNGPNTSFITTLLTSRSIMFPVIFWKIMSKDYIETDFFSGEHLDFILGSCKRKEMKTIKEAEF